MGKVSGMGDRIVVLSSSGGAPSEIPQLMVDDLLALSLVSSEALQGLATAIEAVPYLDGDSDLEQIIATHITDPRQAEAAFRALDNIQPGALEVIVQAVAKWREADSKNATKFDDDRFAALQQKLPLLVRPFGSVQRLKKADSLRTLTGNQLQRIELLCDARPVYNADRTKVEAMVLLTLLQLRYDTQSGESCCVETYLSEHQLTELVEKGSKALQKLAVLRGYVQAAIEN